MSTTAEKRERAKRERREAVLAAAEEVFLGRGLHSATMDEIARVAGVSKGALYLYFESKDELFLTLALEALREVCDRAEAAESKPYESGREQFRAIVHAYVGYALEHESRYLVAMSWLPTSYSVSDHSPLFADYRARIARVHACAVRAIERGRGDGSLRVTGSSEEFAFQVWASAFGLVMAEQNAAELARRAPLRFPAGGWTLRFLDHVIDAPP